MYAFLHGSRLTRGMRDDARSGKTEAALAFSSSAAQEAEDNDCAHGIGL
jgi:hypothetical protein